jgi:LPXTG-motif cell wall-anchored protein
MSAPLFASVSTRARLLLQALLIAVAVVLACGLLPGGTASAAAPAIDLCNGSDNVGGEEVRCEVTISNTLDLASGVGSSTVTVQECHGAAGAPTCGPATTSTFSDVTTAVSLCNGSGNGGGGVVACSVRITNTITGNATTAPATVNQCNGSGQGGGTEPTVQCSPIGSTTSATVTQCNDSGNGGGGTLRVRCDVEPSTQSSSLPVTISQCNGSGGGGGATVTCRSSITNDIRTAQAPAPSATPAASPSSSTTPAASATPSPVTASPSSTPAASASPSATPEPAPVQATPTAEPAPTAVPVVEAPVAGVPVAEGAVPAAPLPQTVLPAVTPLVGITGGSSGVLTSTALPRTGDEAGQLTLLGLLLTVGGAFFLLLGRTPRSVGRHERPAR